MPGLQESPAPQGSHPLRRWAGRGGGLSPGKEAEGEEEEDTKSPGEREKESGEHGGTGINAEGSEEGSEDRHRGEEKAESGAPG